jgi:hypothetical protein
MNAKYHQEHEPPAAQLSEKRSGEPRRPKSRAQRDREGRQTETRRLKELEAYQQDPQQFAAGIPPMEQGATRIIMKCQSVNHEIISAPSSA